MRKALIVFNSRSKKNYFHNSLSTLVYELNALDYKVEIYATQKYKDAYYKIKNYKECDLVVVSGGDGTINEVVSGITKREQKPKVLYFPSGTVNDFAYSLGLNKNFKSIMNIFKEGQSHKIDTGIINDRYFNYVCAIGNFTSASFTTNQKLKNTLGPNAYFLNGLKNLGNEYNSFNIIANVDGEEIKGEFQYCIISNSASVAGLRHLFPNNSMDDGKFQLLLVKKNLGISLLELPKILLEGVKTTTDEKIAVVREFEHLTLNILEAPTWSIDGEKGPVGDVEIKVLPKNVEIYSKID